MDTTTMILTGVAILGIGAAVALFFYRKKNIEQLFNEVYMTSKQIPKQKRNAFMLLMFKESLASAKKGSKAPAGFGRFNNPKALEIQLLQMTRVLKDSSKVTDKTMKKAVKLYESYQIWEKSKNAKAKKEAAEKAA